MFIKLRALFSYPEQKEGDTDDRSEAGMIPSKRTKYIKKR